MIRFYGILDFYPNREEIKEEFDDLTISEKRIYKKEVYSLCFEREYVKDLIWEYLNDWEESYNSLCREYEAKRKKVEIRRMEIENDYFESSNVNLDNLFINIK